MNTLAQRCVAEAIGTFALVFVGCGAVVVQYQTGLLGHGGVATAFGLAVAVMIYATGHISGAHFNPAVSLAFASLGRLDRRALAAYLAAQAVAAVMAATMLALIFDDAAVAATHLGTTVPASSAGASLALEVLLTFFLMFVITAVATDGRAQGALAGVAIGGCVTMCALMGGPESGASLNPARSLGPALVSGQLEDLWIYVVAPPLGAVLAAQIYRWINRGADAE